MLNPLKVSSRSNPNSVAGALVAVIRDQGYAEMQAVGAGALNQAVKAVAIARGFVAPSGGDLVCAPAFTDIEINGEGTYGFKIARRKAPAITSAFMYNQNHGDCKNYRGFCRG